MFNNKAQGSLEYLIIVAAVLAIGAIVILFLVNTAGSGNVKTLVSKCQTAASSCATTMMTSGLATCSTLETCNACDTTKVPQLVGKITTTASGVTALAACNIGNASAIIVNSS